MSNVSPVQSPLPAEPRIRPGAPARVAPARPTFEADRLSLPTPARPRPATPPAKPLLNANQKFGMLLGGGLGGTIGLAFAALNSPVYGLTEAAAGWLGLGGLVGVGLAAALLFGIPALVRLIRGDGAGR